MRDNNVAIGFNSGPTSTGNNLSHTISIGANVKPANSNSCVIGDPSLNINVGIASPQAKLQVVGDISCNTLRDASGNIGSSGEVLSSTGGGLKW